MVFFMRTAIKVEDKGIFLYLEYRHNIIININDIRDSVVEVVKNQ